MGASLSRIAAYLRDRRVSAEVLVVDDGSADQTSRIAEATLDGGLGRVVRNDTNRGKGYSVRRGVL